MFGVFNKKESVCEREDEAVDYTPLLELLSVNTFGVEEVYIDYTPSYTKVYAKTLSLKPDEKQKLKLFSTECGSVPKIESILEQSIKPIVEKFYSDHENSLVVYSPLGTIAYCNTISNGWYLLMEEGEFTLSCTYRVFKEQ